MSSAAGVAEAVAAPLLDDLSIEALINDRRMAEAEAAVAARLKAKRRDADALFYRGACAMVARRFADAQADFAAAGKLRRREPRFRAACAAACMAGLKPEEALEHARAALDLAPDDVSSLFNAVQAMIRLQRFEPALPLAERLNRLAPEMVEARALMGAVLRGLGRVSAALSWFEAALTLTPDEPELKVEIAVCIGRLGDGRAALKLLNQVLEALPAEPNPYYRLGARAWEAGSPHLALRCFQQGLVRFPDHAMLCAGLGIVLQTMGQPAEALFYSRRATELDANYAPAWFHSGLSHQSLRQREEAEACYRRCIEIDPGNGQALLHLAGLIKDKGRGDEAIDLLRRAVTHERHWLPAFMNLFEFLKEANEFEEAEKVLADAEKLTPDESALRQARASLLLRRGDIREANALYREILQQEPQSADAMSGLLFCSNYDPELTPAQIAEAYKSWDRRFTRHLAPPADFAFSNPPQPKRRIRLGYVSGDMRVHSVAFFFEPLLAHHDHQRFEVFCYANQKGGDATTERMMKMADHWRWILDLSDEAVVEMIRMDGVDILIDLSNHTAYHRLSVFARKPAPIQMTTIGMPTTTGVAAIDWRITDEFMDPPGLTEELHAEKLLRILSAWCYRPPEDGRAIAVGELPALKKGHLTFASFNAFGKINPRVFRLWGRLLQAIPDAELVVATGGKEGDEAIEAQVRQTCEECGVPLARLKPIGRKPFKEYFEYHNEVDIVLDAFPYTGATVTAHALWMGVPVITLAGPSPIHRSATSMMNSVGLPEFVAESEDDYIAIARRFADDVEALAAIRQGLRARMQASPLMDGERVTRSLEEAYRRVWRQWCETQKENNDGTDESDADGTESPGA